MLVGAIGVLAEFPLADPIVGVMITIAIPVRPQGRRLGHRPPSMDAVDPALVDTAEASLRSVNGVRGVETLKLRWVVHRMRAEAALLVDPGLSVVDGHAIAVAAHHRLLHDVPRLVDATVHVSPTGPHGDQQHQVLAHHR